jgi:DNA-binding MarR family transcriptional regulator
MKAMRIHHDQVRKVRSFNRAVSQRIGALNSSYLDRGRPLGEARLLYEIGCGGADVRDLRAKLELDSGYVSRLLRSLERQGLIKAQAAAKDARVRRATLTRKGLREVTELDRLSNALAESVLAPQKRRTPPMRAGASSNIFMRSRDASKPDSIRPRASP